MTLRIRKIEDRAQWLEWRQENINASEAAAVMGLGRYATPLSVWHKKKGTAPDEEETDLMVRGLILEPAIMAMTRRKHPDWQIEAHKFYYDDPEARIGCTPDFLAIRPDIPGQGLIQGKAIAGMSFNQHWIDDGIAAPIDYQIQTLFETKLLRQAGLDITWSQLNVLVVGDFRFELHEIPVAVSEGAWTKIRQTIEAFWKRFDAGGPEPAAMAQDEGFIKSLYPADDGSHIDLSGDNELPGLLEEHDRLAEALSMARETANKAIKPMEKDKKAIDTQIKAKLGAAASAVAAGRIITCKTVEVKPYSYRLLGIKQLEAR